MCLQPKVRRLWKGHGYSMSFFIQASNPRFNDTLDTEDKVLSEAIESVFPLNTENAILTWNYICIPLSYKYDISYMIDDILCLLQDIETNNYGKKTIQWLPDTFRCNWLIEWCDDKIQIVSVWENVVGNFQGILNEKNKVSLSVTDFVSEWKEVLAVVIRGLECCGYNIYQINDMNLLLEVYKKINCSGILYRT